MSHFVVAVVTKNVADLKNALQPFHEYECDGVDDEYVQDIDRTEEALKAFSEATEVRLRRTSDGTLHNRFDEKGEWKPEFSQPEVDSMFPSLNRRVEFIPE